jgi:hypothetical protein
MVRQTGYENIISSVNMPGPSKGPKKKPKKGGKEDGGEDDEPLFPNLK